MNTDTSTRVRQVEDYSTHLTEDELADRWKVSAKTLQNHRVSGEGPPYLKLGRAVRYRLHDIEIWEAQRRRHNTSQVHDLSLIAKQGGKP